MVLRSLHRPSVQIIIVRSETGVSLSADLRFRPLEFALAPLVKLSFLIMSIMMTAVGKGDRDCGLRHSNQTLHAGDRTTHTPDFRCTRCRPLSLVQLILIPGHTAGRCTTGKRPADHSSCRCLFVWFRSGTAFLLSILLLVDRLRTHSRSSSDSLPLFLPLY